MSENQPEEQFEDQDLVRFHDDGSAEVCMLSNDDMERLIILANDIRAENGRELLDESEAVHLAMWANHAMLNALVVKMSLRGDCSIEFDKEGNPEIHWVEDNKQMLIREIDSLWLSRHSKPDSTEEPTI